MQLKDSSICNSPGVGKRSSFYEVSCPGGLDGADTRDCPGPYVCFDLMFAIWD